jgi:hypothetical protein
MAGLSGNTPFYNVMGAIDMLIGRFGVHDPGPGARRDSRREGEGARASGPSVLTTECSWGSPSV